MLHQRPQSTSRRSHSRPPPRPRRTRQPLRRLRGTDVRPIRMRAGRPPSGCHCCPPSAGDATEFVIPDPSSPLRVRPAAHSVGKDYIAKLAQGVGLMKALPADDPRSFTQQANVHCAYCDGAYSQVGFPDLELQVHNSWLFLPWHPTDRSTSGPAIAARPRWPAQGPGSFLFYDENANLVKIRVRDCIDSDKLRYEYQDVGNPCLNTRPTVTSGVRPRVAGVAHANVVEPKFPIQLDSVVTAKVKRPKAARTK
ncbi:hypothetical protein GW17_00035492 [Ensete ventricosum]|nr:hypothetical protein GW17_00035492 [Ensete ventricosum]